MALGTGAVIADSKPLNINVSVFGTPVADKTQVTFVPKNPDGTVYDTTSATGVTFTVSAQPGSPFFTSASPAVTLGTHDATGITITITAANVSAMLGLGGNNLKYTLFASDGTTDVILATGTLTLNSIA
jgi:hypothetical protein